MKFTLNDPLQKQRRKELRRNQTEAEKALWLHLRDRQFHGKKFYRQYSAGPYILDFYCPQMKLAVELDGGQHARDENRQYDVARTDYLKALGIDILRFWNHEVLNNTDDVLARMAVKISPS
jgi:very-short-patch-repair endonuclease